jgi:hypothetical protein
LYIEDTYVRYLLLILSFNQCPSYSCKSTEEVYSLYSSRLHSSMLLDMPLALLDIETEEVFDFVQQQY